MLFSRLLVVVASLACIAIIPTPAVASGAQKIDAMTRQSMITRALVLTQKRATKAANTFCGTHETAAYTVSTNAHLQRIFNVDQAIRIGNVVPARKEVWWQTKAASEYWRLEASYLRHLLEQPDQLKAILSGPFNPSMAELLIITIHTSRHAPEVGAAMATKFREFADGHDFKIAMANQIDSNVTDGVEILKAPQQIEKLPARQADDCFGIAHEYYESVLLAKNTQLAKLVPEALQEIGQKYGSATAMP